MGMKVEGQRSKSSARLKLKDVLFTGSYVTD